MSEALPPREALDPKLLPVFLAEAEALLPDIRTGLALLAAGLSDAEGLRRLQRSLHTLKGTARMTGAMVLGEAVHQLEIRIKALGEAVESPAVDLRSQLAEVEARLSPLQDMSSARPLAEAKEELPTEITIEALADRLHRVCDRAALDLAKRVRLHIEDNAIYFERSRLEAMAPALDHLVRNAVAHGIEPPAARTAAGKPAWGEVRVEANWSDQGLGIEVSDDGAGIDADLLGRIFEPGFSTAEAVNHTAGLGIGLDAVQAVVAGLGGTIEVESEPGRGSRFKISLPV